MLTLCDAIPTPFLRHQGVAHSMLAPQHIYLARWYGGMPVFKLGNLAAISYAQDNDAAGQTPASTGWARAGSFDELVPYMSVEAKRWWEEGVYPKPEEAIKGDMFPCALLYRVRSPVLSIITIYGHITLDSTTLPSLQSSSINYYHIWTHKPRFYYSTESAVQFYQLLPYMDT